jgi:hypothetical protein
MCGCRCVCVGVCACSLSLSHSLATLQRDSDSHIGNNIFGNYFFPCFFFTYCPHCPSLLSPCPFATSLATVLNALRFNLTAVTPYCFLKRLTSILAFDDQVSLPHSCLTILSPTVHLLRPCLYYFVCIACQRPCTPTLSPPLCYLFSAVCIACQRPHAIVSACQSCVTLRRNSGHACCLRAWIHVCTAYVPVHGSIHVPMHGSACCLRAWELSLSLSLCVAQKLAVPTHTHTHSADT